jgi:hypothetical protein
MSSILFHPIWYLAKKLTRQFQQQGSGVMLHWLQKLAMTFLQNKRLKD